MKKLYEKLDRILNLDALLMMLFVASYNIPLISILIGKGTLQLYYMCTVLFFLSMILLLIRTYHLSKKKETVEMDNINSYELTSMSDLEKLAKDAKKSKCGVGLFITVPGCDKSELIINPYCNIDNKLEYYKKSYDEDLTLKAFSSIRIKRGVLVNMGVENVQKN